MTSVSPQIIYNENPLCQVLCGSFRWFDGNEVGYEWYTLYNLDNTPNGNEVRTIKVNTSTNVWEDGGPNYPTIVTDDGVIVTCIFPTMSPIPFIFTKPSSASWISPPEEPDNNEGNLLGFVEASLTYDNSTNKLTWILPASYASTTDFFVTAHRTDYVLQNLSAYVVTDTYLIHTQGTATFGTSNSSILAGTWVIKRIISAPNGSTGVKAQVIVTQTDVDAYNAPPADDPPADDPPADDPPADSGINAPPNTPRSRRGNLNFW